MQLTPAQMGMSLMIRGSLPMMPFDSWAEGIARGRQQLMQITGQDHVYDLRAWHKLLLDTNAGGYKWANGHRGYAKEIETAIADSRWQQAVSAATADSLLERLNERETRQRAAMAAAEHEWAGKLRSCPKCSNEFSSVRDRGQCTNCGHIFYASHPMLGNVMWWVEV